MEIDRRWPEGIYVRELPSVGGKVYSQVVASSGSRRIDVAGTLPFDENQELVGEGDIRPQNLDGTSWREHRIGSGWVGRHLGDGRRKPRFEKPACRPFSSHE